MEDNVKIIDMQLREDNSNMGEDKVNLNIEEDGNDLHIIIHPKKRAFLAAISETGNIVEAVKASGITRKTHYNWMESDSSYAQAFKDAMVDAAERLEIEARRRAVQGTLKPVFYQGTECGTVREYSDTLLIFLLKGALPEKYKERYEGTINSNVNIEVSASDNLVYLAELQRKLGLIGAIPVEYQVLDTTTTSSVLSSGDDDKTSDNPGKP